MEVPFLVNKNGIQPTYVGELPTQLAVEGALTGDKEKIYQAIMMAA